MTRLRPLVFLVLAGCGPSMGQVDGKLVWPDGKPVTDLKGDVVFESTAGGLSARGTFGPDGSFKLKTAEAEGAPVGEYKVAVVEDQKLIGEGLMAPPQIDPKFRDFKTSGLTASIKSGVSPVTLTVSKTPGKK